MADGIKISEMKKVDSIENNCCFPMLNGAGENKRVEWQTPFDYIRSNIFNNMFPVGAQLCATKNPATWFGGTWAGYKLMTSHNDKVHAKDLSENGSSTPVVYLWVKTA